MRTVSIVELEHQLSGCLQHVKNGEEIVVRDHSVPIARIVPFRQTQALDREAQQVATGELKMPEESMDWDQFFLTPAGDVSGEAALEAVLESRGDR